MKLLTSSGDLKRQFVRLLGAYKEFHAAVAWAGIGSEPFEQLALHPGRIKRMIVGLHFYQTHPDFIRTFLGHDGLRYMEQPDGTFHPKLYLFENRPDDWELLVGSANFTGAAFERNTEATLLVRSTDPGAETIRAQALTLLDRSWQEAKPFGPVDLAAYEGAWARMQPKRRSLEANYGGTNVGLPIHRVDVCAMDWRRYMERLRTRPGGKLPERIELIQRIQNLFASHGSFESMALDDRKRVAGTYVKDAHVFDWKLFGSMIGSGRFKWELDNRPGFMSTALDHIPAAGQVTQAHYRAFIDVFKAGTGMREPLATATRLLAMKRPDVFVCVASKNKAALAGEFGIPAASIKLDTYWDEIIARIQDSEWWQHPTPANEEEQRIAGGRAAFLDVLYYEP